MQAEPLDNWANMCTVNIIQTYYKRQTLTSLYKYWHTDF